MPRDKSIKTVLIIGSGPIVIGQACEFDYSGTQAARSLREEGIQVILINSNPATIMTDPMMADKVYLLPLNPESIEHIIEENVSSPYQIDAVLATMGGQTALNLAKECDELGIWEKYHIKLIGVDIKAIDKAEDREKFRQWMIEMNIPVAPAKIANSFLEGKEIAQSIGFPLVIRPSFTLGGTGGSLVFKKTELDEALNRGLNASPMHEVLVEKAMMGWKEFELEVRDTKRGEEELTSEIPNVSEEAVKHLDENGIIRIGAEVREGDILIGKITPKGETDPTPEEKLLRAIFGDKAGDVKDASLKAPPSLKGVVIETKLFSRPKRDKDIRTKSKKELDALKNKYSKQLTDLRDEMIKKLTHLLNGKTSNGVKHKFGDELITKGVKISAKVIENNLFPDKNIYRDESNYNVPEEVNLIADVSLENWTTDEHTNELVSQTVKNYLLKRNTIAGEFKRERFTLEVGDELPTGIVQLAKVYVAKKRKLKVGDKMAGRHGNKGVVARIVREEDMPFLEDGTPVDICLNPLGVPSRMNLGQIYETVLAWAGHKLGRKYATPIFDGASLDEVQSELTEAGLPPFGRTYLYDGLTGEKFDQPVTVGMAYMLKLGHLVDDKMHARSIGPYSLITQQPLGGKAQFGGQRFGEMEVWAIEAFGASHILQEILTIKSDDVIGRAKAYEAIVKGENMRKPNIPESFNVLVHELRGLALEITMD